MKFQCQPKAQRKANTRNQLFRQLSNKITIITGIIYSDETLKNIFSLENLVSRQLNSVYAFKY